VSLESHQPDVLREMVGLGLGWTVLPTAQAEHGPSPLARIDRSPLLTRTISAVSRRGGARHPAVQTFIEELAHGFVAQQELKQP
jgi:DNA-binding transcriptional LysR family regulator